MMKFSQDSICRAIAAAVMIAGSLSSLIVLAESDADVTTAWAKKALNPIAAVISKPFHHNYVQKFSADGKGSKHVFNIQPATSIPSSAYFIFSAC
ncbi:MAG: hypothetical protein PHV02_19830 [Rhodocyclaceae bacterium]|nr:hypothetical protein [Rhodocyclaceae bacterium]